MNQLQNIDDIPDERTTSNNSDQLSYTLELFETPYEHTATNQGNINVNFLDSLIDNYFNSTSVDFDQPGTIWNEHSEPENIAANLEPYATSVQQQNVAGNNEVN